MGEEVVRPSGLTTTLRSHTLRCHVPLAASRPWTRASDEIRGVIAPEVGGGFGCKLNVYGEEVSYLFRPYVEKLASG